MKVTWQEDDIQKGVAVCRHHNATETRSIIVFQHIPSEGPRYSVYNIVKNEATEPMSKADMATHLNANGYVPSVMLTL